VKAKAAKTAKAKASPKVKVKKELGEDAAQKKQVRRKADKQSAKAKAKARATKVKVKKELDEDAAGKKRVRKEAGEPAGTWEKQFYVHQSGFVDQVMATAWDVCYGALGTGIVGVRPEAAGEAARASTDTHAGAAPNAKARGLAKDDVLILFRNAPKSAPQRRSGAMLAGYRGGHLDLESRSLEWSSQRSDKQNKVINAITDHLGNRGQVIVAVRPAHEKEYRLLGHVSRADGVQLAECLVSPYERVIKDSATGKLHKAMTVACLSDQVMKEGRLSIHLCEDPDAEKLCTACCYRTPNLIFHFDELEPAGVEAYYSEPPKQRIKAEPC